MVINTAIMLILIPGDPTDLNNYLEPILWVVSLIGLFTMTKAGAALATSVLCITLSTSVGIVFLAYYVNLMTEPVAYINVIRIAINAVAIVYMFKSIFAGKFK
jgi:hypothetical protein